MRILALTALVLLSACDNDPDREDQTARDQRDVALVQKANSALPPLEEIEPEPMTAGDFQRYDLKGQSCNYAPGTSLGTRVVAREADAFVKIAGEMERFAADPGSRELPQHSRTLYSSKNYSLRVQIGGDESAAAREGEVEIRDVHGRVVYDGTGPVTCSS